MGDLVFLVQMYISVWSNILVCKWSIFFKYKCYLLWWGSSSYGPAANVTWPRRRRPSYGPASGRRPATHHNRCCHQVYICNLAVVPSYRCWGYCTFSFMLLACLESYCLSPSSLALQPEVQRVEAQVSHSRGLLLLAARRDGWPLSLVPRRGPQGPSSATMCCSVKQPRRWPCPALATQVRGAPQHLCVLC